ncbi:efflux RND transporter periplasmic adaptor subunit [Halotalea alkalilenta]|uniref:Uncharacterized protein n=1 Tax=Halotalea alkalilenta TaxID=376489 RepID=A0A172YHN2_9GAMM|nr:efflux RND transporter periplasmic adaptor subunit [Halotalea alkalilenta]ANF58761.1 hypothetical protein A5892_15860 [Halotalea alkalilenta]
MRESAVSRRPLWLALVLSLLLLAVLLYYWYRPSADTESTPGPRGAGASMTSSVSTMPANRRDFPVHVSALGTVASLANVSLRPRVEGTLESIELEEGEWVSRGQVVARIDDRSYRAALAQARGQLAQDEAQLATAEADLARYQRLGNASAIAVQELDTQRQLVRQYQGMVAADRAAIESAEVDLSYTVLTSPVDGVVGIRNVDPGNLVSSGDTDPILTITQLDPISVIFSLPSQYRAEIAGQLATGMQVDIYTSGERQHLASGQLSSLDSTIDVETGTLRMRARFDNPDAVLYPNQFVNVRLQLEVLPDAVVIPETALQTAQDGLFVYVVDENQRVERRPVTMAASGSSSVAIASGLEPGEQVVVDGVDRLRTGMQVEVVSHSLPGEQPSTQRASGDGSAS